MKNQQQPATRRTVRNSLSTVKLDKSAVEGKVRFPWLQQKKKRKLEEKQQTYQAMKRVGAVSMIQIGEDEFRMPTRRERRGAGIRPQNKNPLAVLVQRSGAYRSLLVTLEPSHTLLAEGMVEITAAGVARRTSAAARERTYTRKAKGRRKAETEVAASYAAVEHPRSV